jgi:hypothetical protein
MSKKRFLLTLGVVVVLSLVIGCAKAPQQEVDAAKAALEAAKTAEGDRYLPDLYNAAQDTLNAALAEIETQNSKFALTRNYGKAKQLLASALNLSNQVSADVAAKKEEVKADVAQKLTDLNTSIADTKALLKKAPRGKEGREILEAMTSDLTTVENSTADVNALVEKGDFLAAKDKVNAALAKVNSIKEELTNAIAKKGKK